MKSILNHFNQAESFIRKAKEAISQREEQVESFIEFDAALPIDVTVEWTKLCQAWEADPDQPNPFVIRKEGASFDFFTSVFAFHTFSPAVVTDSDVRLRLAREEADALARGNTMAIHQDISPSILIFQGIQLEDLQ